MRMGILHREGLRHAASLLALQKPRYDAAEYAATSAITSDAVSGDTHSTHVPDNLANSVARRSVIAPQQTLSLPLGGSVDVCLGCCPSSAVRREDDGCATADGVTRSEPVAPQPSERLHRTHRQRKSQRMVVGSLCKALGGPSVYVRVWCTVGEGTGLPIRRRRTHHPPKQRGLLLLISAVQVEVWGATAAAGAARRIWVCACCEKQPHALCVTLLQRCVQRRPAICFPRVHIHCTTKAVEQRAQTRRGSRSGDDGEVTAARRRVGIGASRCQRCDGGEPALPHCSVQLLLAPDIHCVKVAHEHCRTRCSSGVPDTVVPHGWEPRIRDKSARRRVHASDLMPAWTTCTCRGVRWRGTPAHKRIHSTPSSTSRLHRPRVLVVVRDGPALHPRS